LGLKTLAVSYTPVYTVDVPALAYCGFGIKCNPQKSGFWKYQIQIPVLNKHCSSELDIGSLIGQKTEFTYLDLILN
jgi:hypothetical protein